MAGRGDGVLILLSLSLGVSFRVGSDKKAEGSGEADVCDRVMRLSAVDVAAVVVTSDVAGSVEVEGAAAASSAVSSSPQGHMERKAENLWQYFV